ncbi:MAG: hypothetical protein IH899_21915 [Planctomycetes bacterium]|nr:hypothetical protein [Planctomycetota bacterium]
MTTAVLKALPLDGGGLGGGDERSFRPPTPALPHEEGGSQKDVSKLESHVVIGNQRSK